MSKYINRRLVAYFRINFSHERDFVCKALRCAALPECITFIVNTTIQKLEADLNEEIVRC